MLNIKCGEDIFDIEKIEVQLISTGMFGIVSFEQTAYDEQEAIIRKYLRNEEQKQEYTMYIRDNEKIIQEIKTYGFTEITRRIFTNSLGLVTSHVIGNLSIVPYEE